MANAVEALLWGLLSGGALVLGALIGWVARVPVTVTALVMAFGAGVLTSALAFELVGEAVELGGLTPTAIGFGIGAVAYTVANVAVCRLGARHRKRSGTQQMSESEQPGSGTALAVGALLDGVPESVVLGASLLTGSVSPALVVAIFLSNLPEGLSSAAGMKRAGRSAPYVFGLWASIAVASGIAALVGFLAFDPMSAGTISLVTGLAAGAILAMIVDTMIPEAVEVTHLMTGLVTSAGFLVSLAVSHTGG